MNMTLQQRICIIGAGGHGKVVISVLRAGGYLIEGVFDDNPAKWGGSLLGVEIRGGVSELASAGARLGVVAIGDNTTRQRIARDLVNLRWLTVVHPFACVHESARLGPGTVVFAGAVVQPEAVIGSHVIINTGATVDHDCEIADFAHLAPGVHLAGSVRIGMGTVLGAGSSVAPNRRIGEWTTVGVGAAVALDLPDHVTAVGVPARPIARGAT